MMTTPLILPFVIWGAIAVAGLLTVGKLTGLFDDPKKNKLGVLGMHLSGKTTFLNHLGAKVNIGKQTTLENYQSFDFDLTNGKKIHIEAGKDIGGTKTFMTGYTKIIENSDIIFFFLDIKKYLENYLDPIDKIHYQRDCNSRLDLINTNKGNKKVVIFATHADQLSNREDSEKSFYELIKGKKYSEMVEGIVFIDLTNKTETESIINKIFNN